jgi:alkanesulfonate monooxygenase SsuD/methylene tetrahydromethanopterin reductase-like flavin-dependent oxidoreductase (luciferase family)
MGASGSAVAVMFPWQTYNADDIVPYAELVASGTARRLWAGQSMMVESHQSFAYLAGMGIKPAVGIGVTLMPLRHPVEAAVQARSLALLTGRPVVVGYGAATPGFVADLRGAPYRKPATAAAGYAAAVRGLLNGEAVTRHDEAAHCKAELPAVGAHPIVEVGLGVLRPGMARAAGAVADVAITWLTPPNYIRDVLAPALAAGAVGRRRPPRIVAMVHAALARPGRDPSRLVLAGARQHLSTQHYTDMLRQAGVMAYPDDPAAGAHAFVSAGAYAYGSAMDVAKQVRTYRDAGVDEVVLNLSGVAMTEGDDAAVKDLTEILQAVGEDDA